MTAAKTVAVARQRTQPQHLMPDEMIGNLLLRRVRGPTQRAVAKPGTSSVPKLNCPSCWTGGNTVVRLITTNAKKRTSARSMTRPPAPLNQRLPRHLLVSRRKRLINTTTAAAAKASRATAHHPPPAPSNQQLRRHLLVSMVPFAAFGFMDNSVMIHAGNAIDCTIGVLLGLSTLSAAAIGQVVANGMSVLFGGSVDSLARSAGLPSPSFTSLQRKLPIVTRVGLLGNFIGVVAGSTLGLLNLLIIDTSESANLKIEALTEEHEFAFEVEASNSKRKDATLITVRGPDVDGLLASISAALTECGCTVVEIHGQVPSNENNDSTATSRFEDVFVVRPMGRHQYGQIEDSDLDELARNILEATRNPLTKHSLRSEVEKLRSKVSFLRQRVQKLEGKLQDQQISLEFAHGEEEEEESSETVEANGRGSTALCGSLAQV